MSALLDSAVRGTRFDGRWASNRAGQAGVLGIVYLGPRTRWSRIDAQFGSAQDLRGNCRWLSEHVTVVCDVALLEDNLQERTLYAVLDTERQLFASWVLLHEVGHAVLGHSATEHSARMRAEYQADCWSLDRIRRIEGIAWTDVVRLASNLISGWFKNRQSDLPAGVGIIYDYNAVDPLLVKHHVDHPSMVMRAARVLQLAAIASGDPGIEAMTSAFRSRLSPDPFSISECHELFPLGSARRTP